MSAFGIVILTVIAALFYNNHESMMGSINSPTDGKEVARTIMGAVVLYVAFFLFCGCQIWTMQNNNKIRLD